MALRLFSALTALPIVLWLMHTGGWVFGVFGLVVGAICLYEFMAITMGQDQWARLLFTALGLVLMLAIFTGRLGSENGLVALTVLPLASATYVLARPGEVKTAARRMGMGVTGVLWAGGLLAATCALRQLPGGFGWLLLACALSWGSDTGGYFAGRAFGRHKLAPTVSPGKTWEGAVGGVLLGTVLAFGIRALFSVPIPSLHLAILSPIAAAMGMIGDLSESLLKRSVGVKDSGSIMPGHGGLLDRVDALIFVGPVVLMYALLGADLGLAWLTFRAG